jgi:hypothetical protein
MSLQCHVTSRIEQSVFDPQQDHDIDALILFVGNWRWKYCAWQEYPPCIRRPH